MAAGGLRYALRGGGHPGRRYRCCGCASAGKRRVRQLAAARHRSRTLRSRITVTRALNVPDYMALAQADPELDLPGTLREEAQFSPWDSITGTHRIVRFSLFGAGHTSRASDR
jgi:hypothetical protein